jgi:serine/threonine protein kinase/Tfp pilus assembly protein PilF
MESNDALTGRTLAHYAVHEVIGAGGMGVVYRARDLQLERPVALKVVGQKDQLDQQAQSRLMREARTASVLNHPNICTIYGAGTEEGVTYIAMELVEGRSLDAIVSAAALPQETVCRYAVQIADALAHAHESGVIHRDLKCANVIITPKGQAKVLDFGLARREAIHAAELVETATQTGVLMGTFAYMAPEILQGNIADARSDLWALGVILYRALSGKLPFHALQRDSPAVLPPSVPPALSAIVHRLLANEPVARYQSAAEVRDALHAIQSAAPQGPRRRWLWPAVAAAVVALIVPTAIELARKTPAGGDRLSDGYRPSSNKQANEYYERGITLYGPASTRADPDQMKRMAELAVQADPKFGAARALYAWTLMMQLWSSVSNDSGLLYSAESEARRALSDDPTSGAHRVLAVVHLLQGRKELFPAEADRAVQVNPRDAFVSIFRILYDQLNGDYDRALPRTRQVILRNPLFWPPHWYLGDLLREQGDISGAVQEQSRVLEQDPENGAALASLARAHLDGGDLVQAHQALDRDHSIRGLYRRRAARALLFACEHKRDEAMKEMDAGLEAYFSAHAFAPLQAAEFYAVMGDTTKALDWVDRALHMGDDREDWLRRDPHLASIRDDPRFQQMLASVAYRRSQRIRTP